MRQKLDLSLQNTHRLVVSPKLRQALAILQLPSCDLANYLHQELAANPLLELDCPWEEPVGTDPFESSNGQEEWLEYWYADTGPVRRREPAQHVPVETWHRSGHESQEELALELRTLKAPVSVINLAVLLLDQLDRSGFLPQSDEELAKTLNCDEDEVAAARRLLLTLEPRGLGSLGLADYLCRELRARGLLCSLWERALREHLPALAAGQVGQVALRLDTTTGELQSLLDSIAPLAPRPGQQLAPGGQNHFVLPDVVVEKELGVYNIYVNESALPRLAISPYYLQLLRETEAPEVEDYINERLRAATWLVKSLEQRRETLHRVASAIVAGQYDFFEQGVRAMRPLTLAQVARSLDIHESTVSRAVANKYLQTPRGIYPMRFFFTSGVADSSGLGVAKEGVQEALRNLLAKENPAAPYSDQQLANLLAERLSLTISRRTVGKYREEMGILSSRGRKRF